MSLFMFMRDEFPTPESLEDLGLSESYYSDLPQDVRRQVLSYKFTVEAFGALARGSGWTPVAAWSDPQNYFSVQALLADQ